MTTFLAILLIAVLGLVATSRLGFRLRRWRLTSALVSGGWLGIAAGAAIGPHGLGVATGETVRSMTPLVVLGLGWIGLMIGLQANRRLIEQIPRPGVRAFVLDAAVSLAVFGALGWFGVRFWLGSGVDGTVSAPMWPILALVACSSLGWALETRSLARGDESSWRKGTVVVRGAGGLALMAAVLVFGAVFALTHRAGAQAAASDLPVWLIGGSRLALTALLGVAAGLIGRFALREAGGNRGQWLAVVLGVVALVGGLAHQLDLSPLLVAGVTGAVIGNLAGTELRSFERLILKAEHAAAVTFAILAGVLLDPAIGWRGVMLAAVIAGARAAIKPAALRAGAGREMALGTLGLAAVRQSPLAVALAVSLVMSSPDDTARKLLTVIVLAGLLSQMGVMSATLGMRRAPMGTAVDPAETSRGGRGAAGAAGAS